MRRGRGVVVARLEPGRVGAAAVEAVLGTAAACARCWRACEVGRETGMPPYAVLAPYPPSVYPP